MVEHALNTKATLELWTTRKHVLHNAIKLPMAIVEVFYAYLKPGQTNINY
jgi:hypothetical protein